MLNNYIFTSINIKTGEVEHFTDERDLLKKGYDSFEIFECLSELKEEYKGRKWFFTEDIMEGEDFNA